MLLEKDLWCSKLLEENICSFNSVAKWIERWLSKQDRMLLGLHLQLVKNVAPKGLHIIPILNNSVLNWVSQLQDTFVFICCLSDKDLLIVLCDHDFLVYWAANIRIENKRWFCLSSNTGFHLTRAVVNNNWTLDDIDVSFS